MSTWRSRLKVASVHLALSVAIAAFVAWQVFGLWYPYPYQQLSDGRQLFMLVVGVDVALGPLITFAIFNRSKSRRELCADFAIIGIIQFSALAYGLWTVAQARPVHLVFEYDRFRVVHAVEVPNELIDQVPRGINAFPLSGPTLLSLRPFRNSQEKMDATLAALQGVPLSARPDLWQPYAKAKTEVLAVGKPVSDLKDRFPNQSEDIQKVLLSVGRLSDTVVYVPLVGRKDFWTIILDRETAEVMAFMPLDSF